MSEIWNLGALCRCCHVDGDFKSLELPYVSQNQVEVYATMLYETFGVSIKPPPFEASYSICDVCIGRLRDAKLFRDQVVACDQKFQEYCQNEQQTNTVAYIKIEVDDVPTNAIPEPVDDKSTINITYEGPGIKSDDDDDFHDHDATEDIKEEDNKTEIKLAAKKRLVRKRKVKTEKDASLTKTPRTKKQTEKKQLVRKRKVKTEKDASLTKTPRTKKPKPSKPQETSLEVQLKTEKGDIYSCKLCGGTYNDQDGLKQHIKENHSKMSLKCEHCPKVLGSKNNLIQHLKIHTVNDRHQFKCSYCDSRFTNKTSRRCHENTQHTKKVVFTCDLCKKDFYTKPILTRHLRWHYGMSKAFVCESCGLRFANKANLKIHIMTVHEKIRFTCNVCEKAYNSKKTLRAHMCRHTGNYPFLCDLCPSKFLYETSYKRHKMAHGDKLPHEKEKEKKKKYQCKVCPASFESRGKFKSHVMKHSGFLPYKCHLCSKDFSCKYSLNRHVFDHSGVKRYHCEICQEGFTQKTALLRHVDRVHDPTKGLKVKLKCDLCKKNVHNLEKHKQKHVLRPHMCQDCKKSYPTTSSLNRHIRIEHLGHRSHPCDQCSKAYTRADALKNHKKKKHIVVTKVEQDFDMGLNVFNIQNKHINVVS